MSSKWLLGIFMTVAVFACESTPEEVNTDMIHFPSSASGETAEQDLPSIAFENETFDFGSIAEGEVVSHAFVFTNSGKAPLVISKVEGTCGCTVMRDWPKAPIAPGEKGEIVVEFNSNKRPGKQQKTITVLANTVPATNLITIQGNVVGPEQISNE